jgi:uncharacterized protein (DUF885 family)
LNPFTISRRGALAGIGATTLLPLLSTRAFAAPASEAEARALLDEVADRLLHFYPESASSLGVDTGPRAALRSRLGDRSAAGRRQLAQALADDLARAEALDTSKLSFATQTSVEVVKSAYRTALAGFALPYGDVSVGGWRNTPYVVIQNVGAYIDVPQFLDTDHPIETAADAEAYLSRLAQYPSVLDGELGRMRDARGKGLVPPSFLIDKAIAQLGIGLKAAHSGGDLVDSLVRRTREKGIPGDWAEPARQIVIRDVAPALQRQIDELQAERAQATNIAGMWSRPHGDEYYRWALRASTTTDMSPD